MLSDYAPGNADPVILQPVTIVTAQWAELAGLGANQMVEDGYPSHDSESGSAINNSK